MENTKQLETCYKEHKLTLCNKCKKCKSENVKRYAEEKFYETIANRVDKIRKIVNDPYKAPECAYTLVCEIIDGKFD